jgi:lipopolysaccharide transport system ATP-binding protein
MEERIQRPANIQLSWLNDDALIVKYEELLSDEHTVFAQILDYCGIEVDKRRLHYIIEDNSFESVTGRKPGEEDLTVHQRKGIAGDWRNHFSKRIKEKFKKRFGDILINTGYESDFNW